MRAWGVAAIATGLLAGAGLLVGAPARAQVLPGGQEALVRSLFTVDGCALERAQVWPTEVRAQLTCDAVAFTARLVHPGAAPDVAPVRGSALVLEPADPALRARIEASLRQGDPLRWVSPVGSTPSPEEAAPEETPHEATPHEVTPRPAAAEARSPVTPHHVVLAILALGWLGLAGFARRRPAADAKPTRRG